MEKQTIHRAFGYVIFRNEVDPKVVSEDHGVVNRNIYHVESPFTFDYDPESYSREKYNHIWFYTKGRIKSTNIDTGESFEKTEGYCTLDEPHPLGRYQVEFIEPTVFYCLGPEANLKRTPVIPRVKSFRLKAGEVASFEHQTKMFLCGGSLAMRGIEISDICQLTIGEDTPIRAITPVYGLIFE